MDASDIDVGVAMLGLGAIMLLIVLVYEFFLVKDLGWWFCPALVSFVGLVRLVVGVVKGRKKRFR